MCTSFSKDPMNHLCHLSGHVEDLTMIHEVGNIELCELLDSEPKTQCKVCISLGHWHPAARAGTSCETEQRRTRNLSSTPRTPHYNIEKKPPPRAPLREEARGPRVLHRQFAQEEVQKRSSTWVSTTGSHETRSSARTCLTPVALRKCVARWTTWRTKTTRIT